MSIELNDVAPDPRDRAINHIFRCGLTLTGLLNTQRVDDESGSRLRDVIADLDAAVVELRNAALMRIVRDADAEHDTFRRHAARAIGASAAPVLVARADRRRCLCRFDDGEVFAYSVSGHDFLRASDDELWAHESDDLLLSARTGSPLARRVRKAFHDIDSNVPLYFERAE